MQYEYDSRGRTTKVTPPQGSSYRTEYQYNIEGTLKKVRVYDAATCADTDYVYSTTTGKLTQRDFPTESSQHIRTSYTYDSAGRLSCETVTREAGGTTNLSRTNYTYAYSTASHYRELVQEEESYGGGWINSNQVTYRYDGMERLSYEKREEWLGDPTPAYVQVYLIAQEYDKKGNRTRFNKDVTSGHTDSYGKSMDLSYTYNAMNALSVITDADDAYYGCAVTCDANNNITAVTESVTTGGYSATLYTSFGYDWANRMQYTQVRAFDGTQKDWRLTKREHGYDAAGRLVNSTYKQWWEQGEEPAGDSVEHAYAGSKHVQNFDGDASYGAVWHWAGAQNSFAAPVKSPNPDTAAQDAYNIANATTPQRKTWQSPTTAGDQRNLFGQGKPMAKDSSGDGADWGTGIESYTTEATVLQIESRLDFDGTVAPTDLDRATDAREKGRIGIFGSALSYAGNSGRVTSEPLGRDLNPLGRGDGGAYIAGAIRSGFITPELPYNESTPGTGFSVNNAGQVGSCAGPCCVALWGDTLQAMGPPPADECGLCSDEEWRSQCDACHYRHCACIAHGCIGGTSMIAEQMPTFKKCLCERFGMIDPPAGGHPGNCTPGKLKSTGGGGGGSTPPGGGGGPDACPGCGGGGGFKHTSTTPLVYANVQFDRCNSIYLFWPLIKANVKKACETLLNCECLPADVKKCLERVCGIKGLITLSCQDCKRKGMYAGAISSGDACIESNIPSVSIQLCVNNLAEASKLIVPSSILGHELLHSCDCKVGNHTMVDCQAKVSPTDGSNPGNEGWAQACENACFGYDPQGYEYTSPGYNRSWCCMCKYC